MFVDKVEWKLSFIYGVNVLDFSVFLVVVKVIFGLLGGSVKCKEVFVDFLEGFLILKIKEVCI